MDAEILLLIERSHELLEKSRKVHREADQIRRRLMIIDVENCEVMRRSELRIRESKQITESMDTTVITKLLI